MAEYNYDYRVFVNPWPSRGGLDVIEVVSELTLDQIESALDGNDWIQLTDPSGNVCSVRSTHVWRVAEAGFGV